MCKSIGNRSTQTDNHLFEHIVFKALLFASDIMILDHDVLLWCYELLKNNGDGWNFSFSKRDHWF